MERWFIAVGAILVIAGLLMQFAPGLLNWFGHLPGDIRRENEDFMAFARLTSMLILSVVATLVLNLIIRLWQ